MLGPAGAAVHVHLDLRAARELQLDLTAASVALALVAAPKLKIADKHVRLVRPLNLRVCLPDALCLCSQSCPRMTWGPDEGLDGQRDSA